MAELRHDSLDLLNIAIDYIKDRYVENRHHVVCALIASDHIYMASHLDTVGGLDICAEPIALSNALAEGHENFEMLVTVAWNGNEDTKPWVITPCGNCRQILSEYAPELQVIVDDIDLKTVSAHDLLPHPYVKRSM